MSAKTNSSQPAFRSLCDSAGQRRLTEPYADGSIRYRNEANHLCLLSPDDDHGRVSLYKCEDITTERRNLVNP
ncbi:hypothetical protein [Streptomyces sp. NBC_00212]|uniref:hypothetical protein n=1 Tax=Streptomyces sp. NBC_00212 TaxID=2975684 RepID=UPI0032537B1B